MARRRPQVLIVGAGWGGLALARRLRSVPVDVTRNALTVPTRASLGVNSLGRPSTVGWIFRHEEDTEGTATVLLAKGGLRHGGNDLCELARAPGRDTVSSAPPLRFWLAVP